MEDNQADAAFEEAEEALFLLIGDVLDHVVENNDIEIVEVRLVVGVGIFHVHGLAEGSDVRVLRKHFVKRFLLEAVAAGDDQDMRLGGGRIG